VSTSDDLRRRTDESRVRVAAVETIREQHQLIAERSRRRLTASRLLLDRRTSSDQVVTALPARCRPALLGDADRDGCGRTSAHWPAPRLPARIFPG
jgi:hypothetical protein